MLVINHSATVSILSFFSCVDVRFSTFKCPCPSLCLLCICACFFSEAQTFLGQPRRSGGQELHYINKKVVEWPYWQVKLQQQQLSYSCGGFGLLFVRILLSLWCGIPPPHIVRRDNPPKFPRRFASTRLYRLFGRGVSAFIYCHMLYKRYRKKE